jgi:hypothetical protein
MHILSASLGKPHPLASTPIIKDPLLFTKYIFHPWITIMINNSMICISNLYNDVLLVVAVVDWRTGEYIVRASIFVLQHASLLSLISFHSFTKRLKAVKVSR